MMFPDSDRHTQAYRRARQRTMAIAKATPAASAMRSPQSELRDALNLCMDSSSATAGQHGRAFEG